MHINKPKTDLRFNVAQLLREETGARRNYTFSEDAVLLDEATTLRSIEGSVRFARTTNGVLATVQAHGLVNAECMRCLKPIQVPIDIAFRDEFHSVVEVTTGVALPQPDEDDPFFITESHLVDLEKAIREYALIALPMRPLCSEDCQGLCPTCGTNRNEKACDCSDDDGDSRFDVLKNLLAND